MKSILDITYTLRYIILPLLIIFGICVILLVIENITSEGTVTIKVDCYDHYYNKINDITCEKQITCGVISQYLNICIPERNINKKENTEYE